MPQMQDEDGNIWEVDAAGNAIQLVSQAGQSAGQPVDPGFQYEGEKAEADAARARIGIQGDQVGIQDTLADNARDDRRVNATIETENVKRRTAGLPSGYMWNPSGDSVIPIPGYSGDPTKKEGQSDKTISAMRLLDMLDGEAGISAQYQENFKGGGIGALAEYNPLRAANQNFDSKANAMLPFAKKLLRTPGEGSQSDKEAQDYRDQLPRSTFRDSTNEQLMNDLRNTALSVLQNEGMDTTSYNAEDPEFRGSAWEKNRMIAGQGAGAAEFGSTTQTINMPDEMQQENQAFLSQWAGNPDVRQYVQFREGLDKKYGYTSDPIEYAMWASKVSQQLEQGGYTLNPTIPGLEQEMTNTEQLRNNAVNNPLGAAAVGFTDAVGMGGVRALAGNQINALEESQPVGSIIGQIGGAIGATGAIGAAGRQLAKQAAPKLLNGSGKAQFGRNIAADATYGAGYGGVTEGDPLTGAALGAAGSGLGQAAGRGLSNAVGGVNLAPAVQALKNRNVPLTTGQTLGGAFKAAEDKAASLPIVGDMIKRRTNESFKGFNEAAFKQGGEPIGFTPRNVGEDGVNEMGDAVSDAYTKATNGVNVEPDQQFFDDLVNLQGRKAELPDELQPRFDRLMSNHTKGVEVGGSLSGEQYQRAIKGLKSARSNASQAAAEFAEPYREITTGGIDAFDDLMMRGGGDDTVNALSRANSANKNMKILEDASLDRAKIGTQTGEAEVFLPSQLLAAARKSEKKYGRSDLKDFAKAGQEVLPSTVPNSGTADRVMQAGLATTAIGGAAGYDYANETAGATPATLAALAVLAAGGTRRGQNMINGAITLRPEALKRAGEQIRKRQGMFGSAAVPLTLQAQ